MKPRLRLVPCIAVLLLAALWTQPAQAQGRGSGRLGLGLILGSPTGPTLEYGLSSSTALHFALGIEGFDNRGGDDDFYLHLVWKFYLAELANTGAFSLPFYAGVGGFVADIGNDRDDDIDLGVRAPFGIAFQFHNVPFDIYFELPVYLQVVDNVRLGVGGAFGFQFFF